MDNFLKVLFDGNQLPQFIALATAIVGAVGALLRGAPAAGGAVTAGGGGYQRYYVDLARSQANDLWVPIAAQVFTLTEQLDRSPAVLAEKAWARKLRWQVLPWRIRKFLKSRPEADIEESRRFADQIEKLNAELFGSGRQILMPPRIVKSLRSMRLYVASSKNSNKRIVEWRWQIRGHFLDTDGILAIRIKTARVPKLSDTLKIFPATLWFMVQMYLWLPLFIATFGQVRFRAVFKALPVDSGEFLANLSVRLHQLDEDIHGLLAGR